MRHLLLILSCAVAPSSRGMLRPEGTRPKRGEPKCKMRAWCKSSGRAVLPSIAQKTQLHRRHGRVCATAGQGVVDTWVGEFQQASMDGRRKGRPGSVRQHDGLYGQRMSKVDVDLIIPIFYRFGLRGPPGRTPHRIGRTRDTSNWKPRTFAGAAATFKEIIHLDAEYGDAKALLGRRAGRA